MTWCGWRVAGESLNKFATPKTFSIAGAVKLWLFSELHAWLVASERAVESPYDAVPPSPLLVELEFGMLSGKVARENGAARMRSR